MKYFCLIFVLLYGIEVKSLSILPKKTQAAPLSLFRTPTTTTKKPLQAATNGLASSLSRLLGLSPTQPKVNDTPSKKNESETPISVQKINTITTDFKSIIGKLNAQPLLPTESDTGKKVSTTTKVPLITSTVRTTPPCTSDVRTTVSPVKNVELQVNSSKSILSDLKSPHSNSKSPSALDVEVKLLPKLSVLPEMVQEDVGLQVVGVPNVQEPKIEVVRRRQEELEDQQTNKTVPNANPLEPSTTDIPNLSDLGLKITNPAVIDTKPTTITSTVSSADSGNNIPDSSIKNVVQSIPELLKLDSSKLQEIKIDDNSPTLEEQSMNISLLEDSGPNTPVPPNIVSTVPIVESTDLSDLKSVDPNVQEILSNQTNIPSQGPDEKSPEPLAASAYNNIINSQFNANPDMQTASKVETVQELLPPSNQQEMQFNDAGKILSPTPDAEFVNSPTQEEQSLNQSKPTSQNSSNRAILETNTESTDLLVPKLESVFTSVVNVSPSNTVISEPNTGSIISDLRLQEVLPKVPSVLVPLSIEPIYPQQVDLSSVNDSSIIVSDKPTEAPIDLSIPNLEINDIEHTCARPIVDLNSTPSPQEVLQNVLDMPEPMSSVPFERKDDLTTETNRDLSIPNQEIEEVKYSNISPSAQISTASLPDVSLIPPPIPGVEYVVSTKPNTPTISVSIRVPEKTNLSGVFGSLHSVLANALPVIPKLGDLVIYILSILNALLVSISGLIGISVDYLISNIPGLPPLLNSLLNLPGITLQVRNNILASAGQSYTLLTRLGLSGIGGLTDLLNLVFYFLIGLLRAIPNLLGGVSLDKILSELPNLIGTFENILPNLRVGSLGFQYQAISNDVTPLEDPVIDYSIGQFDNLCNYRDAPVIDIHHNEINLVKIVIG